MIRTISINTDRHDEHRHKQHFPVNTAPVKMTKFTFEEKLRQISGKIAFCTIFFLVASWDALIRVSQCLAIYWNFYDFF